MMTEKKIKILKSTPGVFLDYPDNKSLAIVVYMLGCEHNCNGCQNLELQDINYSGYNVIEITLDIFKNHIERVTNENRTNKLVLSGGDPLNDNNLDFTKEFLKSTNFDVCVYTGYPIEYAQTLGLSNFKFLKCGRYMSYLNQRSIKTDDYLQFSSKNQELYDSDFRLVSKNGKYYFY